MNIKKIIALLTIVSASLTVHAQLTTMGSMYYQNRYLINPAMAGVEAGVELNAAYRAQWVGINDSPKMQSFTAAFGSKNRQLGLGLSVYNETAGLIRRTQFKGTYAYHIQLNRENNFLDFGLSAGVSDASLDVNRIQGSQNDVAVGAYNQRKMYFDGEFGVAFRTDVFNVQFSMPSLKEFFYRDMERVILERPTYFGYVGYRIIDYDPLIFNFVEPMVAFRILSTNRSIVDVGLKTEILDNKIMANLIYHSSNSFTIGLGLNSKRNFSVLGMFKTNTSAMSNYSNGEFELSVRYNIKDL